jgi:hypothetical protein
MATETWAAALLIAAPLWFNATFALLAKRFDYPDRSASTWGTCSPGCSRSSWGSASNEERGWALAGAAIPVLYIAWSIWLLGLRIALMVR